jgi:hypothetical protein
MRHSRTDSATNQSAGKTAANKSASRKAKPVDAPTQRATSLEHRLRLAGLIADADDTPPEDMDAFRYALVQRIAMFINRWPRCPEPRCRRQRGCMAPRGFCTNAASHRPATPGETAEVLREIQRITQMRSGQHDAQDQAGGEGDAPGQGAPVQATPARRKPRRRGTVRRRR